MRSEVLEAGALGCSLDNMPNRFWGDPVAPDVTEPVHSPEDRTCIYPSSSGPFIDRSLHPRGHRDGADMLPLADQVGNDPVFLPNLEVLHPQPDEFRPPESTPNQQRQDGVVAFAAQGFQG